MQKCFDGSLVEMIKSAAKNSEFNLELHIKGGYVDDPSLYDPYGEKQKKDHYIFELDKDFKLTIEEYGYAIFLILNGLINRLSV
jgi:hypothetical protein